MTGGYPTVDETSSVGDLPPAIECRKPGYVDALSATKR